MQRFVWEILFIESNGYDFGDSDASKAYRIQMDHLTYRNNTPAFKARIYETYKAIKAGKI